MSFCGIKIFNDHLKTLECSSKPKAVDTKEKHKSSKTYIVHFEHSVQIFSTMSGLLLA